MRRICWDIETEPFTEEFRRAETLSERIQHAPEMRLACAYEEHTKRYQFFMPAQVRGLMKLLINADEIVSYNGKRFDLLVLRKHYGLTTNDYARLNRRHVDMCEKAEQDFGRRYKLDSLSRLNLGEAKRVDGRAMAQLGVNALKRACKSDVSQTYRLWRLFIKGELRAPTYFERNSVDDDLPLIGHHIQRLFPLADLDTSEMTEGQEAEYLAGTWAVDIYGGLLEMGSPMADRTGMHPSLPHMRKLHRSLRRSTIGKLSPR